MRRLLIAAVLIAAAQPLGAALSSSGVRRVEEAAAVLTGIHAVPDKDLPQELWEKAACVMVIPGMKKAAFVFGGEYGKGLMSCRRNGG